MTNELITQKITEKFNTQILQVNTLYDILTFEIDKEIIAEFFQFLYHDNELGFTFLTDLTAVHYPEQLNRELAIVYLLQNIQQKSRIRVKVFIDSNSPIIPSVTSLYATANWLEREAYDFFGIQFTNHPNLIRIMNVDEMDYFPLLKQYPLEDQTRTDKDDEMFGRMKQN